MKRPSKRFILAAFVVSSLTLFAAVGVFLSVWYGPAITHTVTDATSSLQQTRAFTTVSGWLGHDHGNATTSDSDQDEAVEEPAAPSNHQRSNNQHNNHRSNILAASSNLQRQGSNHRNNHQNHRNNQQNHRPTNQQNHHRSNNQQNQRNHHRSLLASDANRDIIGSRSYFRTDANARFEHPLSDGAPTHPCQEGAIFRRYAFTARDNGKLIKIVPTGNPTFPLTVLVNGFVRTLATVTKYNVAGDLRDLPLDVSFSLCGIEAVSLLMNCISIMCLESCLLLFICDIHHTFAIDSYTHVYVCCCI